MAKKNAYDFITEKIIESLESGVAPWKKPWNLVNGALPVNVTHKGKENEQEKHYNGINLLMTASCGYASPYWGTFKNWADLGATVNKGKSVPVVRWITIEKKDKDGNKILDDDGKPQVFRYPKAFWVWNVEETNGLDLAEYMPKPFEGTGNADAVIVEAQAIVDGMPKPPKIEHGGNSASYSPTMDRVRMPLKDQFNLIEEYYSTLFHELSHSTGHKSRVGRNLEPTHFGSESYSFEELVAEISTCFLCSTCGIDQSTFDNSAAYIKGWLKKLKDNKKMIITASSNAKKSAEYILNKTKEETDKESQRETESV